MNSNNDPWAGIDQALRRSINAARAARGMSWDDVAATLATRGWEITAGNLMTRHSRMAFRADELVLLLDILGVKHLSIDAMTNDQALRACM